MALRSALPLSVLLFVSAAGCHGRKTDEGEGAKSAADADEFSELASSGPTSSSARADVDSDGIYDEDDACPDVPGVANATRPERHGCPAEAAPDAKPTPGAGPAATMVGFRDATKTSATVYVQLTESPKIRTEQRGHEVTVYLSGIRVPRRNNQNPLVATHFDSVVESARLTSGKKESRLVIRLRRPGKAKAELLQTSTGVVLEVQVTADDTPTAGGPSAQRP